MPFTRKMLKAMGIEDEKIDQIMEAHSEVVDALKEQRDAYKVDAEKLPGVQKKLEELEAAGNDEYKEKYEAEHTAFEKYKADVAEEKANSEKGGLYRQLLKELKVDPKRIDAIMRVTDISDLKVKDGKLEDTDKLTENIKNEWSGFIVNTRTDGANVEDPPGGGGGGGEEDLGSMSMKDYIAARQKM